MVHATDHPLKIASQMPVVPRYVLELKRKAVKGFSSITMITANPEPTKQTPTKTAMSDIKFLALDELVLSENSASDGAIPSSIEEWGGPIKIEFDLWASNRGAKQESIEKALVKAAKFGLVAFTNGKIQLLEKGLNEWKVMRKARSLPTDNSGYKSSQPQPQPQPQTKVKMNKQEKTKSQRFALKDGHTLHKIIESNPRREGTQGHESWEALKNGMTYIQAIDAGVRNRDLRWDILKGNIEIRDKDGNPVSV